MILVGKRGNGDFNLESEILLAKTFSSLSGKTDVITLPTYVAFCEN
jgi:hypothetical protein